MEDAVVDFGNSYSQKEGNAFLFHILFCRVGDEREHAFRIDKEKDHQKWLEALKRLRLEVAIEMPYLDRTDAYLRILVSLPALILLKSNLIGSVR